MDVKQN